VIDGRLGNVFDVLADRPDTWARDLAPAIRIDRLDGGDQRARCSLEPRGQISRALRSASRLHGPIVWIANRPVNTRRWFELWTEADRQSRSQLVDDLWAANGTHDERARLRRHQGFADQAARMARLSDGLGPRSVLGGATRVPSRAAGR